MTDSISNETPCYRLRTGIVVRVQEQTCQIAIAREVLSVRFATGFPSPRAERVSPGHLVALATAPGTTDAVVWRWYDAVVLEEHGDLVRLWEPAHGEVLASPRSAYVPSPPGARAYLSAGLPGAEWWVAGRAVAAAEDADVELDEVEHLYTQHGGWDDV